MKQLSKEAKKAIVGAYERKQSIKSIAKEAKVSVKTVRRWVNRWKATGGVKRAQGSGRKRVLTGTAAEKAHELLLDPASWGAAHVAQQLFTQGHATRVHSKQTVISTVRRVAAERGVEVANRRGSPKQQLTKEQCSQRLAFAKKHMNFAWGNVLFTDRKKFLLRHPGAQVRASSWHIKGQFQRVPCVSRPVACNIYAGLSMDGVTKVRVVAGSSTEKTIYKTKKGQPARNITAAEYEALLQDTLLPEGRRIFASAGKASWVFQQDNDPTHRQAPKVIAKWNAKQGSSVKFLDKWPACSPDLNPIENLWAWVDRRVQAQGCENYQQFKAALIKELRQVPLWLCKNLVGSMGRRLQQVVERDGQRTKY